MGDSFNERIDNLRKRSRFLLAQVNKNSKKVKDEFEKFHSQNLILKENSISDGKINLPHSSIKKNNKSWKLRNDSSGVGGALRSDCFCKSPNQTSASMPNTSTAKKILISSKKHPQNQPCLETIYRKPVKECYCNTEIKKPQLKSARSQLKSRSPCKKCRGHINFPAVVIEDNCEKSTLSSPISCETLRRVQRIDYTPKSQFLRNVRSRASLLQAGDCPNTCFRSQSYHEIMDKKNVHDIDSIHRLKVDDTKLEANRNSARSAVTKSKSSESSETESVEKCSKGIQVSLKKHPKPKVIRRTVSSKASVPDIKKSKSSSKVLTKSKKTVPSKVCHCCHKNMPQQSKAVSEGEDYVDSEKYQDTVCTNKFENEIAREHIFDREMRDLKKFREQNYFDTHGSSHTLSSKSSGSLEQYLLNDRLFPEPVKRIHRKDLVVTMPPCATTQLKRMHYFPRYIVRQEKNNFNINNKKKRCQTCPLTGHAIDLGVTKIRPPLNSLALKYQKRLP